MTGKPARSGQYVPEWLWCTEVESWEQPRGPKGHGTGLPCLAGLRQDPVYVPLGQLVVPLHCSKLAIVITTDRGRARLIKEAVHAPVLTQAMGQ